MAEQKVLTLRISEEEHRKIKTYAAQTGQTIKELMMECLQQKIREYEEGANKGGSEH